MMSGQTLSNDGEPNVLSVLERAADDGCVLLLDLRDGRRITDGVCAVRRACGEDFVVLHAHNLVRVSDIVHADTPRYDDSDEGGDGAVWCSDP